MIPTQHTPSPESTEKYLLAILPTANGSSIICNSHSGEEDRSSWSAYNWAPYRTEDRTEEMLITKFDWHKKKSSDRRAC
jgi:hypothetical protein